MTQLSRIESCYEAGLDYYQEKQTYILDFLARFFVVINCSINFVIYCLVGSQFRTELSSMMDKHFGSGKKVLKLSIWVLVMPSRSSEYGNTSSSAQVHVILYQNAALFLQEKENENLQIQDEVATRLTPTMKSTMVEG